MLVSVAYSIVVNSLVGPNHAATDFLCPCPNARSIESPDTTGTSTRRPKAMISDAMETCCKSIPKTYIMPKVSASVIGIESAIRIAERQLQNPSQDTTTTRRIASHRLDMNRSMFSVTCCG